MSKMDDFRAWGKMKNLRESTLPNDGIKFSNGTDYTCAAPLPDGDISTWGTGKWEDEVRAYLKPKRIDAVVVPSGGRKITVKVDVEQAFADLQDTREEA